MGLLTWLGVRLFPPPPPYTRDEAIQRMHEIVEEFWQRGVEPERAVDIAEALNAGTPEEAFLHLCAATRPPHIPPGHLCYTIERIGTALELDPALWAGMEEAHCILWAHLEPVPADTPGATPQWSIVCERAGRSRPLKHQIWDRSARDYLTGTVGQYMRTGSQASVALTDQVVAHLNEVIDPRVVTYLRDTYSTRLRLYYAVSPFVDG